MKKCKLIFLILVVLYSMTCISAFAQEEDLLTTITNRGYIIAATTLAAKPMAYMDEDGNPVGFEIDLMKLFAEDMGVELKIEDMAWSGLIPALLAKRVDIVASRMTPTLQRATMVVFTNPWIYTGKYAIALREKGYKHYKELDNPNIRMGSISGATSEALIKEMLPKAPLISYELDSDVLKALLDDRIDATSTDEILALEYAKEFPQLMLLEGNMLPGVYSYTLRPDFESIHLKEWMNLWISTILMDGRYGEIYEKWLGHKWEPSWEIHPSW